MGTHTFTAKGIVDNSCNKSILFTILCLERELSVVATQIKACHEHDMTAFLSLYKEDAERLIQEINALLKCFSSNVNESVA